jgi:hypothetical protein
MDNILLCLTSIQHAEAVFQKACLFFPCLTGKLHNFELMQKQGKHKKWPISQSSAYIDNLI